MGRILVCGGAGYIGSHINKLLNSQGYQTVVFDNLGNGHKEAVKWGELVVGDMSNIQDLEELFSKYAFDAVFHFAAYAYVGESVDNPEKYYYNNVANTLNLLRVMKKHKVNRIIFSSSCATYGIPHKVPITENMEQKPINPYGASKLMVERILKDYHYAYGLEYVILRYFNAAGGDPDSEIGESHDPETHIIPLVLAAAGDEKKNVKVFGTDYDTKDGSCIRDYIHVSDLATAHLLALKYLENGGNPDSFNLGNEVGVSVLEIIEAVKRVTGRTVNVIMTDRRAGDPAILVGSSEKAKEVLGWTPKYADIDTIISHAWEWYKKKEY